MIARKMDFDAVSVNLSLDSIAASNRRMGYGNAGDRAPEINASRIAELEQLAAHCT